MRAWHIRISGDSIPEIREPSVLEPLLQQLQKSLSLCPKEMRRMDRGND